MKSLPFTSFGINLSFAVSTLAALLLGHSLHAANATWNGATSGNWSDASNWSASPAPGTGDTATFNTAGGNTTIAIDTFGQAVKSITFDAATGNYTIGSLGANLGNALVLGSGGTILLAPTSAGTNLLETFNAPLTLGGSYTITNSRQDAGSALVFAGNLTNTAVSTLTLSGSGTGTGNLISGGISDGTGVQSVSITASAGKWTLSGSNNYSGTTTTSGGGTTVLTGVNSSAGATTLGAGTLQLNNTSNGGLASGTLTFNAGTLQSLLASQALSNPVAISNSSTVSGAQSITLNGDLTPTVTGRTLSSSITGGNTLTLAGNVNIGALTGSGWLLNIGGTGNTTISGVIKDFSGGVGTAAGSLSLLSTAGTTTLSGSNTYTGLTTINGAGGTFVISGNNNSAGGTTLTSGTLQLNNTSNGGLASGTLSLTAGSLQSLLPSQSLSNIVSLTGNSGVSGAQAITFNGDVTQTASRIFTSSITGGNALTIAGAVNIDAVTGTPLTLTLSGTGNTTITGAIQDFSGGVGTSHGLLTITNTGTTTLAGANTYQGATSFTGAGGTLSLTGTLNGTNITVNNASATFSESSTGAIVGVSNSFTLTTGTATLGGVNTYGGGTLLTAGRLNINNALALGSGTLTLTSGVTLDNTTANAITVSTGNPVSLNSTLNFGGTKDLNLGSGAVSIPQTASIINVNGTGSNLTFSGPTTNTGAATNLTLTVNGIGNTLNVGAYNLSSGTAGKNLTINGSGNTVIAGVIANSSSSGTGSSLTYSGSGQLTLAGANTYTGATTLSGAGGTLILTGTLNGSNVTVNNATAFFNESSMGAIAGSASTFTLTSGSVNLAGVNTYGGVTTVTAGKLNLTGALGATVISVNGGSSLGGTGLIGTGVSATGGTVTVAGGASASTRGVLDFIDNGIGTLTIQGNNSAGTFLTLGGTVASAGSYLNVETGMNSVDSIALTNNGKMFLQFGGATVNFSALSGQVLGAGTYNLLTSASNTYLGGFGVGTTPSVSGTFYGFTLNQTGTALQLIASGPMATVSSVYWNGSSATTSTISATTSGTVATTSIVVPSTSGLFVGQGVTGTGVPAGNYISAITSGTTFSLSVNTTGTFTGNSLTFTNAQWNTVTSGTSNWSTTAGGGTSATPPGTNTDVFFTGNSATSLQTVLGQDFTINSLNFTGPGTSGTKSVTIIGSNLLTLQASGTNGITVQAGSAAHTVKTNVALGSSQSWENDSVNVLTMTGNIALGSNSLSLTGTALGSSTHLDGSISGSGGLTIDTAGQVVFGPNSGNNPVSSTFTGGIILNSGTLILGGGGSASSTASILGSGTLTINGGVLSATGNIANSSLAIAGQVWNSDWSYVGGKLFKMGTGAISLGTTSGTTRTVSVSNIAGTLQLDGVVSNGATATGLIKAGVGPLNLNGANTYTGDTLVTGGTLGVGAVSGNNTLALQNSTFDTSGAGALGFGVASSNINSATFGGLKGNRNLALVNSGTGAFSSTVALSVGNNNQDTAYSGNLTGGGSLTKIGSGTLTLSGSSNSYTGATTVSAGTLLVSGSLSGTTSVSVAANSTLQVNGSILNTAPLSVAGTLSGRGAVGPVSIQNGGILSPGSSPAVLSVSGLSAGTSGLSMSGTSMLSIVLGKTSAVAGSQVAGTDYSQVNVTQGTISLNSATLTLAGTSGNVQNGDLFFLILNGTGSGISGTFNGLADLATFTFDSQLYQITYFAHSTGSPGSQFIGGNDVALMAVPEPATYAMLLGGIGMLTFWQRLRRRLV